MSGHHIPVSFGERNDLILERVEQADPSSAYVLLSELREQGLSDSNITSILAMSTAKWVDHSGPLIGHGILNAHPTIRSIGLMDRDPSLALLQFTLYVTDILRHPNYGPYAMQAVQGIRKGSETDMKKEFSRAVRSGNSKHLSEKLLARLYSSRGNGIREQILYEALMQYGENEHRLLLPYHTFKLIDSAKIWEHALPLLRPSVQYLSTNSDVSHGVKAEQLSKTVDLKSVDERGKSFEQAKAYDLTRMLLNSILGNEMTVLADYSKECSLTEMYESIALSSTILLLNSDLEHHSVTGKHCLLSLLTEKKLSRKTRTMAMLLSMEGPRARRIKSYIMKSLDAYLKFPEFSQFNSEDDLLVRIEREILRGQQDSSFRMAANYVEKGFDTDKLLGRLLSVCFSTEGPFESLHTSKMLLGMGDVTKASVSDLKWIHLAAGSRFLAEMVRKEKGAAKAPLEQYRKFSALTA